MRPESEEELVGIVAGLEASVRVLGGGTRGVPGPERVLETGGLSGITLYEPGALTLVARAGTPLSEIEAALEAEGQRLAFEPMDHRGLMGTNGAPTIGGVVAANISGPRRIAVGSCRDFLLGVRLVDGTGRVIRNGGRVMKNVTGYDLVKLMAGSWGTLGVLTEVALKVLPAPEARATVVVEGLETGRAVEAMSAALGSPFEVTGAAHLPGEGRTLVRVEGFGASVEYRVARLQEVLAGHGAVSVEEGDAIWSAVRDVAPFHGRVGDVWRVSVKPSDAAGLVARMEAESLVLDWGGGLIWALVGEGVDLRARLGDFAGHATRVRGGPGVARFQPEAAPLAAISAGLRARFDPRGVFNPGLMG